MTPEELKRLRELEAAATPGPWQSHNNHGVYYVSNGRDGLFATFDNRICEASTNFFGVDKTANMEFIAAARNHFKELLDEVERLNLEIKKSTYMEDMHREDCRRGAALEKERDSLKAENAELKRHNEALVTEVCQKFNALEKERDSLKAKVERLEKQPYKVHCPACNCEYANDAGLDLIVERESLKAEVDNLRNTRAVIQKLRAEDERDSLRDEVEKLKTDMARFQTANAGIIVENAFRRSDLRKERDRALARVKKLRGAMLEIYEEPNKMGYPGADAICEEYGITAWTLASKAIVEDDKEAGE